MTLHTGQSATLSRVATDATARAFAELVGDTNPIHSDDAFAARTRFRTRIMPGMWSAGLISAVLGSTLPGPGTIYLGQTLRFRQPVLIGDTITACVEVVGIRADKPIVTLQTTCRNQRDEVVLDGEAVVLIEDLDRQA